MSKLSPQMVSAMVGLYIEGDWLKLSDLVELGYSRSSFRTLKARGLVTSLGQGRIGFTQQGWDIVFEASSPGSKAAMGFTPEQTAQVAQIRAHINPDWTPSDLRFDELMTSPRRVRNIEQAHVDALAEYHLY